MVLDTNVLLPGIFFGGVPGRILDAWQAGRLELVLSPAILAEYRRTGAELAVRYPERGETLTPILSLIAQAAVMVDAPELPQPASVDPDDDKIFACVHASDANVIVSGDKHLLDVSGGSHQTRSALRRAHDGGGNQWPSCRARFNELKYSL